MNPKRNTTAITFRCDVAVAEQLDEICKLSGVKRSEFLIGTITAEYDRLQGNPKMREMLEQLRLISDTMREMAGQSGGSA